MIDSAGTNHFLTLMIFMNYSCILKIGISHLSTYFRQGRGEGTAIYAKVHVCATVQGKVFKQFTLG